MLATREGSGRRHGKSSVQDTFLYLCTCDPWLKFHDQNEFRGLTPDGNFHTLMGDRLSFSAAVRRDTTGNPRMSPDCQPVILFRAKSCRIRVDSEPNFPGYASGVIQAALSSTSTHHLLYRGLMTRWFRNIAAQSFDKIVLDELGASGTTTRFEDPNHTLYTKSSYNP